MSSILKISVLSVTAALALAGCGKGNNNNPQNQFGQNNITPWQTNNVTGVYNQQIQGCSPNMTQLTDVYGQQKCYAMALAQACPQAGGIIVGQGLCRIERELRGVSLNQRYIYIGNFAVNVPVYATSLQQGETLKIIGNVTPRNSDNAWTVELYQGNVVAASAKSGGFITEQGSNVVLVANSYAIQQMQGQPVVQNGQYFQNGQVVQQQQGCVQGMVGCVNPQQQVMNPQIYPQQQVMNPMMSQSYMLRIYGRGNVHVQLKARAIGCEDGRGNRYPCQ